MSQKSSQRNMPGNRRLPSWLRMERASGESYTMVKRLVEENRLHTICTSGNCPNIGECWNAGTATLMILGDICTRSCKFCGTATGKPLPPDIDEPRRVAETVRTMGLRHCVITSVDRDDLPDGGAGHWAETIRMIRKYNPGVTIETLIPDFRGKTDDIMKVIEAAPDVISHNVETVRRLTPQIRSVAKYDISLTVLRLIASSGMVAKSGLMLGLGEREDEVLETMNDLRSAGCTVVTIGQYLSPSLKHMPVAEYITPEKFSEYRQKGLEMGFDFVESSPLVRSSFHAEKHIRETKSDHGRKMVVLDDLGRMNYREAWAYQEGIFDDKVKEKGMSGRREETTPDRLIFVEHDHVYTLGKSGTEQNLLLDYIQLKAHNAEFYHIDRGGDITYHGPGQLVGYPIFDLENYGIGLKEYIYRLEEAVILTLTEFGIEGRRLDGATGVWIEPETNRARKICAIGVRASRYITMHGFALNVNTDLSYFDYINPCGYTDKGVTSIWKETGKETGMDDVKGILSAKMREIFGYEYY